jgi:hypothetical protein
MGMSRQDRTVDLFTKAQMYGYDTYNPWQCQWCGLLRPVPSLARECEDEHEALQRGDR